MKRSQPLVDVESQQREAEQRFNKAWEESGLAEEWQDPKQAKAPAGENGESSGIWCAACKCLSHIMIPSVDFTLLPTGQKMYSKQTVYDAHLTSKKHVKAAQKQAESDAPPPNPNGPPPANGAPSTHNNGESSKASDKNKHRTAALLTHLVSQLLRELSPALNETKSNVERRFSLTAREREQELLEQAKKPPPPSKTPANGEAAEEEEEEERIYNPLKLPLGWDGKPIPYWLYKLHGLGVEYRCEICSDHVYMGRKNFDRHFQVRSELYWRRHVE